MHKEEFCSNVEQVSSSLIPYEEWRADSDYQSFRLLDDSMSPDIQQGDILITKRRSTYDNGALVVVTVHESYTVLRGISHLPKDRVVLFALNPAYSLIGCESGSKNIKIRGELVLIRRILEEHAEEDNAELPNMKQKGAACSGATEQAATIFG